MGDTGTVAALRSELAVKHQELTQLQASFDEYTLSSQELEQELEQELARAEQQSSQFSKKAQRLELELEAMREKLDATQHEMRKRESELQSMRVELARVTAIKRQLEQEQDELTTQVRILQATEEDLRHEMEREMEEKVFLLSDQDELKREYDLVTERLRTEIMDLKSELFVVQQKHDALAAPTIDQDNADDQVMMHRSMAEEQRFSDVSDRMDMDVDGDDDDGDVPRLSTLQERDESDREQLIDTLQQELDVLSVRLQEETEMRERLELDLAEAHEILVQAEAMESEMTEMSDELIEKSQEIRQRDLEITSLQETVTSLKLENTTLLEENAELQAMAEAVEAASTNASSEGGALITSLRAQCEQLEEAESSLREQLEGEQGISEQLRAERDELSRRIEENARVRYQLELQLETHVKKKQKELDEVVDLNASLRRQLETAARKAADLEEKASASSTASSSVSMSSVDDKPTSREAEVKRLVHEIQSLKVAMSSLQAENARLRSNTEASMVNNHLVPNKRMSTDLLKLNYTPDQLAAKYLAERTRNASLLSRLQTVCGNIQVFCRVRPVVGKELERPQVLGVNVINQSDVAAMDIRAVHVFGSAAGGNQPPDADMGDLEMLDANASWKVFTFDRVIGPEENQVDVFREVEPIAQSVVEGFKACIFAYGQTGSGKTHTMEGTESDPGLNYRVISHIFQSILLRGSIYDPDRMEDDACGETAAPTGELCYHIQVGVLEIYNETLRDLVNPTKTKPLEIRQDTTTGDILVPDLTMATAASPEQTIQILRQAQTNRVVGETGVHAHSSRSHSIVIIQISTRPPSRLGNQSDTDEMMDSYVSGKLYMVDLAGSERVKKSNVTGTMLKEAAHINKSLSALADVMEALDKKLAHVPYRNSKLTYLLQDVLNTSCKTVMIVNCGPTLESANETYRSLQLAERVRNIVVGRNSITKNKKDLMSAKRAFSEIQSLKQQIQAAERKFKQSQQAVLSLKRDQKNQSDQVSTTLQAKLKAAETQAVGLRTQSESLKRINDDLLQQLKQEREAKQKEIEQREAAQRTLRQLTSKTRVSTSHQESLEAQLRDREDEIKKLRQMLTEARQRTTTSVIPRHKGSPLMTPRKSRLSDIDMNQLPVNSPRDNQTEDDIENNASTTKANSAMASTRIPLPKFSLSRHSSSSSVKKPGSAKSGTGGGASKVRRIDRSVSSVASTTGLHRQGWK